MATPKTRSVTTNTEDDIGEQLHQDQIGDAIPSKAPRASKPSGTIADTQEQTCTNDSTDQDMMPSTATSRQVVRRKEGDILSDRNAAAESVRQSAKVLAGSKLPPKEREEEREKFLAATLRMLALDAEHDTIIKHS